MAGQTGSVNTAYSYDNADRLTGIAHSYSPGGSGGSTLSGFGYGYDAAGQLTSYTGPEGSVNFTYDATAQLTGASGARSEGYSYDANGNRTLAGYSTDPGNRLASDGTYNYTYDNEGNLLTKTRISDGQRTEFVWDYRNRLSGVVVKDAGGAVLQDTVFTYDVGDRRIGKSVDLDGPGPQAATQLWTVYDGANPYADFGGTGSLTTRYLADPNQPDALFARVAANGTTAWYLRDNIGSVRQVVGPTGTVLDAVTYDSFGNVLGETNPSDGDRFKYTGREYDAELGLYYYRARYYDPATGKFLGEDPLGIGAGDPNFYRYVGNRPTTLTDPSGMAFWDRVVSAIGTDNVRSWDNVLGDYRTGWFAGASNFAAGWGDAVSFGLTSYARQGLGYDDMVNYNSGAYFWGQVGGTANSFLIGYKAAGAVPQAGIWAYRAGQGYTVAGSVYGVGHSSYVLATDPQNFGFGDALGFVPLGGYVTSRGVSAGRMWWTLQRGEYAIQRFNQLQQERRLLREALARETDLMRQIEMRNRIAQISGEINDLRLAWGITLPNL